MTRSQRTLALLSALGILLAIGPTPPQPMLGGGNASRPSLFENLSVPLTQRLTGTDIGRSLAHFATSLVDVNLNDSAKDVLDDLVERELEVRTVEGKFYKLRVRPYRTVQNVVDGIVMTSTTSPKRPRLFKSSE